ncbi:MAG TPA: DUF2231 domain-containing protein [Anaerolineales bacterium]|nr:DUF2231 domain-containing protein [Anaerolineales bacterium]
MESRVKLFGHPVHPMLIVFPLGLLATAVIFDILYLIFGNRSLVTASYYMIAAGVLGGLLAAIFGFIDWLALPNNSRAKSIGLWHGLGNFVIVLLFAGSWLLRRNNVDFIPDGLALILGFAATGLALITAWIGGELVYRLGVGVDPGAHVNAPNSLTNESASATDPNTRSKRTVNR